MLLLASFLNLAAFAQNYSAIPEFVFTNAKLVSGSSNQDGAVYRFNNIAPGYDATVAILGRSATNVVLDTIDVSPTSGYGMGFDKALQPKLGISGIVPPNTSWWMKFKVSFFEAGSNDEANIAKFNATAIDVDGDGVSIAENLKMYSAISSSYSNPTYLVQPALIAVPCPIDRRVSLPMVCPNCGGLGYVINGGGKQKLCRTCNGAGRVFTACQHPFTGEDMTTQGPTDNAPGIDTISTANMTTFTYVDVSSFTFEYGAKSGSTSSNAGVRLNSIWFKAFSLSSPPLVLPVRLTNFSAVLDKKDVKLSWTGMEENFSHYVVQRSTDGKNYSDIAIVFTNNSAAESNYVYKDANVSSSTNALFYRLQMVDKEQEGGKFSDTRIVRLGKEAEALQITTYPNPAVDQVKITLPSTWQGKPVMLQLFTVNGTMIQSMQIGSASQTESMQLGQTSKGFYLVKAICGNQAAQQRIVKN